MFFEIYLWSCAHVGTYGRYGTASHAGFALRWVRLFRGLSLSNSTATRLYSANTGIKHQGHHSESICLNSHAHWPEKRQAIVAWRFQAIDAGGKSNVEIARAIRVEMGHLAGAIFGL